MNRKIECKCIDSRLHTARIDDTLDRQSGEQSERKNNTEIFHTLILSYFAQESKEKTKIPDISGIFTIKNTIRLMSALDHRYCFPGYSWSQGAL